MATASDVMRIATNEIGTDTGRKYWDWYWGGSWGYVDGGSTPWCACFVSWVLAQAGVSCEGFPRAVAIDKRDGFARMVEAMNMEYGDPVGFDWDGDNGGDHIGFFEKWVERGRSFYAIEGNTSGGVVARRMRYVSQVTCAVRPNYDGPSGGGWKIDVDGAGGPDTITLLQLQVGTKDDGVISGQLYSEDRYRRNIWSVDHYDEGSGSDVVYALQCRLRDKGLYHGTMDRCWGYNFTDALQRYLKGLGYYHGGFDHDFAHHSVQALQMALNDRVFEA